MLVKLRGFDYIKKWLVVFIDKYYATQSGLIVRLNQKVLKAFIKCKAGIVKSVRILKSFQLRVQGVFQCMLLLIIHAIEIEVEDGICLPGSHIFLFKFFYSQA